MRPFAPLSFVTLLVLASAVSAQNPVGIPSPVPTSTPQTPTPGPLPKDPGTDKQPTPADNKAAADSAKQKSDSLPSPGESLDPNTKMRS